MTNLRKLAQGQECQIRIPGFCNFDPATSVLCHIRLAGVTGAGQKAPDLLAAIGCSSCHELVDGRISTDQWTADRIDKWFYEGVFRTQVLWLKMGVVK